MGIQTAYKTPTGTSLYQLVYGKAFYLLVEIDTKHIGQLKSLILI